MQEQEILVVTWLKGSIGKGLVVKQYRDKNLIPFLPASNTIAATSINIDRRYSNKLFRNTISHSLNTTTNGSTCTQPHTKKKWTHYFWEFLMLFLAVFAGFLAENQREHIVEHQREKKFARRLLSDLRQDSIFFETRIKLLEKRQEAHKRFLKIMTNPVPATDSAVMRGFVPLIITGSSHDFTTTTYNQMKTSGSLRDIGNDILTTSLQKYYDILLAKVSRNSEGADKFFTGNIISYMTKHFRFQDFKSSDGPSQPIKLLNRSAESDQELINIMSVWASNCDTQLDLQRPAQKQMLELIELIKKEYHLV